MPFFKKGNKTEAPAPKPTPVATPAAPASPEAKSRKAFFFIFIIFQIGFIILFRTVSNYATNTTPNTLTDAVSFTMSEYLFYVNIVTMTLVGYGLLYTFNQTAGITSFLYVLLIAGVSFQWALLVNEFWVRVDSGHWDPDFIITIQSLIGACYTTTTVLITLGGILGQVSAVQMVFIALFECVGYALNKYIIHYQLNVLAYEHAIYVNVFGAFFSIGLMLLISKHVSEGKKHVQTTFESALFSVLGALIIITYFPSYNAALVNPLFQNRVVVNTFLSTTSAALTTFCLSALNNNGKWKVEEILYGTLTGGIVMSSTIAVISGPAAAAGAGLVAALATNVNIRSVAPKFFSGKLLDSAHVYSTHATAGAVACIGNMIAVATAHHDSEFYGTRFDDLFKSGDNMAGNYVAAYFISVGLGLATGIFTGAFFSGLNRKSVAEAFTDADYIKEDEVVKH